MPVKLGNLLVRERVITPPQLEEAVRYQETYGGRIGTNLVELGFIEVDVLSQWLGRITGFPYATAAMMEQSSQEVLCLLPVDLAQRYESYPLGRQNRRLLIAMANPSDLRAADAIAFKTGLRVAPHAVAEAQLQKSLEKGYGVVPKLRYIRIAPSPANAEIVVPAGIKRDSMVPKVAVQDAPDLTPENDDVTTQRWSFPAGPEPKTLPGFPTLPPPNPSQPKLPTAAYMAAVYAPPPTPIGLTAPPAPARAANPFADFPRLAPPAIQPSSVITVPRVAGPPGSGPVAMGLPPAVAPLPAIRTPHSAQRLPTLTASALTASALTPPAVTPSTLGAVSVARSPAALVASLENGPATVPEWMRPPELLSPPPLSSDAALIAPGTDWTPAPEFLRRISAPAVVQPLPGPSASPVEAAATALTGARDQEEIAEIVLSFACGLFDNTLIFFVKNGIAIGWKGRGLSVDTSAVRLVKVPVTIPSLFLDAQQHLRPSGGLITDTAFNRQLYKVMRRSPPVSAAVVPVFILNRVVNLVYVDRLTAPDTLEAIAPLAALAVAVAAAYTRILQNKKRG